MKWGLYGGSFDPIHQGHLLPVRQVREALALERVIYLPTSRPPHKLERRLSDPYARYAMVELALLDEEGLYASAFEMSGERPSYTVDTLEHFHRTHPSVELFFLLGGDSYAALTSWRRWQRIVALAELVVLDRSGGFATPDPLPAELAAAEAGGRIHHLANTRVGFSSSEIRRALAAGGEPPSGALAPAVLNYLRKYQLYRDDAHQ